MVFFRIALRNVKRHKMRSSLAAVGIIIGVIDHPYDRHGL